MYHLLTPEIKKTLRKHIKIIFLNSGDSNLRFLLTEKQTSATNALRY